MLNNSMHNGKYHTAEYKRKQAEKVDRKFGPIAKYTKPCQREGCGKVFTFEGRVLTKKFERAIYCSRSCANNRQAYWNENATAYRTICFQNWPKECALCKFDKIVAVHHIDEDRKNNDPKNLIPLCPNHHEMTHSGKYSKEMSQRINTIIKKR